MLFTLYYKFLNQQTKSTAGQTKMQKKKKNSQKVK